MQTKGQSVKGYFGSLTVIHAAMLLGMLLFAAVAVYIVRSGTSSPGIAGVRHEIVVFGVTLAILAGLAASIFYYKRKTRQIRQMHDLNGKLRQYKSVQIIRYAILEAPVLLVIVAYLLTGNALFLYFSLVLLLVFALFKPGRTRTINDLQLTGEEKKRLEDPGFRIPLEA